MTRRLLPALLAVLAATGCPLPQPPPVSSTAPGVYDARMPGTGTGARIVTLWLQPGGAAALETVVVGTGREPVQNGTWSASGDEVTVRLDGQSAPLVYTIHTDRLVPKQWDRALYGASGLPLARRASYNAKTPSIFEPQQPPGGTR